MASEYSALPKPAIQSSFVAVLMLALAATIVSTIPFWQGTDGYATPVRFDTHPDAVDEVDGRWLQLSVSDQPRSVFSKVVWAASDLRPARSSQELRASVGDDVPQLVAYADFERARLNADGLARRTLGQPVEMAAVVTQAGAASGVNPGDVLVSLEGAVVPIRSLLKAWQEHALLPSGALAAFVLEPDRFRQRAVQLELDDDLRFDSALVSANPLRMPVRHTIGGSSGLVQYLAVLDALEMGDLSGGAKIAATGVVSDDGTVLAIEGVAAKATAARQEGVSVLLVPSQNFDEARAVLTGSLTEPVAVDSVQDAVQWLCRNGGESSACKLSPSQWDNRTGYLFDKERPFLPRPPNVTPKSL